MSKFATADHANRDELTAFLRGAHHAVLITHRASGGLQSSPVSCGIDADGRLLISTYPQRAKATNIRRNPVVSLCVMSEEWNDPYVHLDGTAEVLDLPEALDPFVEYFRSIAGEHPDWEEYKAAMASQGKCLVRVTIDHWGPIATGGFPPELAE